MPYKIIRSDSYKADQTKSGDSLKHYGRKGMKWGKEIFGEDDIPGQSRSSSSGAPPSKALASVLSAKVSAGGSSSGYSNPVTRRDAQKTNMALRSNPGLPLARTPSPNKVQIAGGSPELVKKQTEEPKKDTRNGLQKWFDQAGKDIGKAAGDVKNWGEGAANDTKKWTDQAGKDIGRAVKTTKNSVEKTVTDAIRGTGQWVERAANDTKKWTDNAIKDVSKAAVKVGDDAKKVAEKAKTTIDFAVNDAKKWTDNAIKDIGKTAVKIGDDAKKAYGDAEKWVNGAIKDVGNAAVKVGDDAKKAYGDAKKWVDTAIGDTKKWVEGAASTTAKEVNALVDDIVNGRHSKRNRLREKAYDSKVKRDRVLARGNGPQLDEMDMNRAFSKAPYARSNSTELQRDTGRLRTENWRTKRSIAPKLKTPKVVGPSGSDAKKYLQGQGVKVYQDTVKQLSKNPNDKLALDTMEFFKNTINNRKREERDRK